MTEKFDFQMRLNNLRPDIEKLVRKADTPGTVVSGFIFSQNPRCLIRFGNHGNQGRNLVKLHLVLAAFAAEMYPVNPYENVGFADIGPSAAPAGESPEELADELAQAVLVSGMEPQHAPEIVELAHRYAVARKME